MRVLVTGGLGVNGVWTVRRLLADGHEVVVLDNRDERDLIPELAGELDVVVADVADAAAVEDVVRARAPEVVVHMAAIIGAGADPVGAVRVNVGGTAAVCEAAVRHGVRRVVYTSSRAAYGALLGEHAHPTYTPVTEDHPRAPVGLYDVTKLASEELGFWYSRTHGLEFVALRFATIYGPGKLQRHGGFSTYSSMIELPAAGRPVRIPQGGDEHDDTIYVADTADAVVAATLAPGRLPHAAYNIGTGRVVPLREFADAVRTELPGADIELGPGLDPMGMGVSYYGALDSSRARADLAWTPRHGLREGVRDYLATMARLGLSAPAPEGAR